MGTPNYGGCSYKERGSSARNHVVSGFPWELGTLGASWHANAKRDEFMCRESLRGGQKVAVAKELLLVL